MIYDKYIQCFFNFREFREIQLLTQIANTKCIIINNIYNFVNVFILRSTKELSNFNEIRWKNQSCLHKSSLQTIKQQLKEQQLNSFLNLKIHLNFPLIYYGVCTLNLHLFYFRVNKITTVNSSCQVPDFKTIFKLVCNNLSYVYTIQL